MKDSQATRVLKVSCEKNVYCCLFRSNGLFKMTPDVLIPSC